MGVTVIAHTLLGVFNCLFGSGDLGGMAGV